MAATAKGIADLRSALSPVAAVTGRLTTDDAMAGKVVNAVHSGDSTGVSRLMQDVGVRGVTHTRTRPTTPGGRTRDSFSFTSEQRWHIIIVIESDKP